MKRVAYVEIYHEREITGDLHRLSEELQEVFSTVDRFNPVLNLSSRYSEDEHYEVVNTLNMSSVKLTNLDNWILAGTTVYLLLGVYKGDLLYVKMAENTSSDKNYTRYLIQSVVYEFKSDMWEEEDEEQESESEKGNEESESDKDESEKGDEESETDTREDLKEESEEEKGENEEESEDEELEEIKLILKEPVKDYPKNESLHQNFLNEKWTIPQLKEMCKKYNLKCTGNKGDLHERISEYLLNE